MRHLHPFSSFLAVSAIRAIAVSTTLVGLLFGSLLPTVAMAQTEAPSRFERLRQLAAGLDDGADDQKSAAAPAGTRVVHDVSYGPDPAQRFDVYISTRPRPNAAPAPVVFFVHGGGWSRGDKTNQRVLDPKVAHWTDLGWIVISTNYRMLPTPVEQQAQDVATALAFAQSQAAAWDADPSRFVLMGHSAGAHLIALISAGLRTTAHPRPWRGSVLLDSAALDVPMIMEQRHFGLYDRAFGADPQQWAVVSPMAVLASGTAPMLAVCSSRRRQSCGQADRFVAKANDLGGQARVLREDLSHAEINATLGAPSDYTTQVDDFLRALR